MSSLAILLVIGERRLTEREMLRLRGFHEDCKIVVGYQAMRKLARSTMAIPCVEAVLRSTFEVLGRPIKTNYVLPGSTWCKIKIGESYASYG